MFPSDLKTTTKRLVEKVEHQLFVLDYIEGFKT